MYTMIDGEPVNVGVAFGYCYVPQVYGSGSLLAFSPAGDGETWDAHPYLETQEEAVRWLEERGLGGEVLRYAHHEFPQDRGEDYRPWITSGIVAKVEGEKLEVKNGKYAEAAEWSRQHGQRLREIAINRESGAATP